MTLTGKKVLLGITGGIAAYKAAELTRLLVKRGADVRVAMTEAATRFITPTTLQALSGQAVWSDLWDARVPDAMGHIELSRDRDLVAVVPASADFIAKLAHGLADDLLSSLCLARRCPLLVAPAMNVEMWQNAATQRNVARLREDGVSLAGPAAGDQACGEVGLGRMLEPRDIAAEIEALLAPKALSGKRVLVTAGPTEEPVDPVRMLTNASSGKMGYAMARAAQEAGAQVTLISGPVTLPTPAGVSRIDVRTAEEMFTAVKNAAQASDVFISVAAVADYKVKNPSARKIKKANGRALTLELVENPDILAYVARMKDAPFCVGFAAESEDLERNAAEKRAQKGIPLLAANLAQQAVGADDNAIKLFDERGEHDLGRGPKLELARKLVAHIAGVLPHAK
ncbi:MAG TPA: bifunctional phosphopantothenoylcysteine decarboxylase/phosphopantothenate--cysteine ligase CoaBC [Burkholderiales bacterium]|jgi:phosphopantothenoylcysteine decarboxylase / phosphopantothenate---cysteine ligase|nr:bifunctional phosphopantothenoylcysteine decarboxylase/phosphopantothenate--cysteine ligase CoaBC [Burkholderiales bacterium]